MANFSKEDIEKNKVMAALMFIPVFFVISYLTGTESPYVKHCAGQGMILTILFVVVFAAGFILTHLPLVGGIFSIVFKIIEAILAIIMIVQIIRAATGSIS